MGALRRWLVLWYGLWQAGHVAFNVAALLTGGASARALLAEGLPEAAWKTMWVSGAVDLLFASPTGVLYALASWRGSRRDAAAGGCAWRWQALGLASTTAATYSALLCYWVQWLYAGRLLLETTAQWLGLFSYLPCQLLFFVLLAEALARTRRHRSSE